MADEGNAPEVPPEILQILPVVAPDDDPEAILRPVEAAIAELEESLAQPALQDPHQEPPDDELPEVETVNSTTSSEMERLPVPINERGEETNVDEAEATPADPEAVTPPIIEVVELQAEEVRAAAAGRAGRGAANSSGGSYGSPASRSAAASRPGGRGRGAGGRGSHYNARTTGTSGSTVAATHNRANSASSRTSTRSSANGASDSEMRQRWNRQLANSRREAQRRHVPCWQVREPREHPLADQWRRWRAGERYDRRGPSYNRRGRRSSPSSRGQQRRTDQVTPIVVASPVEPRDLFNSGTAQGTSAFEFSL